jgi:hypothetical protein
MQLCVFIHWTNGEEWRSFRTHAESVDELAVAGRVHAKRWEVKH